MPTGGRGVCPPGKKEGWGVSATPSPPPAVSGTHAPAKAPHEMPDRGAGTMRGVPPTCKERGRGGDPYLEK